MGEQGYSQVELLLWFQNILDVDLQELKTNPTQNKLANLTADCQKYIDAVKSGQLVLPKYSQRSEPEFWNK